LFPAECEVFHADSHDIRVLAAASLAVGGMVQQMRESASAAPSLPSLARLRRATLGQEQVRAPSLSTHLEVKED